MYSPDDPRSTLQRAGAADNPEPTPQSTHAADHETFSADATSGSAGDSRSWCMRGQNFALEYSLNPAGSVLRRQSQPDEYFVLIPDQETQVECDTSDGTTAVAGHSLLVLPPGDTAVHLLTPGRIIRVFSHRAQDVTRVARNQNSYVTPRGGVTPAGLWPSPPDGFKLRVYSLDVPDDPERFGRIFRCTSLMINYLSPQDGPRDDSRLSPHTHADFEQGSLALDGTFIHHLRWPWGTDRRQWRDDQHLWSGSPSVVVIPPGVIHTSEAVGMSRNQLIDVFSPPRTDFSSRAGWVLNSVDYPNLPAVPHQ